MIIPTVPTFADGESNVGNLQALSSVISFLVDCGQRPVLHVFKVSGTQTLVASTWTTLTSASVAYDPDGMMQGVTTFAPQIITSGYYSFEGCVPVATTATANNLLCSFLFTAGSSNPNFSSGSTVRFGLKGGTGNSTASEDTVYCPSALAPACLYPGDAVSLQVWCNQAFSISNNANLSYISGRFVPNMTAYYVRTGP